jgi:hypothetical protein
MAKDTKVYSADPFAYNPDYLNILKLKLQSKTAAERQRWLKDGRAISREETSYRVSALAAVTRMGPAPERTQRGDPGNENAARREVQGG